MRGAKRSAKNTAKNISLLVLCGLMGVLCAVNWLMGLNIAQMPALRPSRTCRRWSATGNASSRLW